MKREIKRNIFLIFIVSILFTGFFMLVHNQESKIFANHRDEIQKYEKKLDLKDSEIELLKAEISEIKNSTLEKIILESIQKDLEKLSHISSKEKKLIYDNIVKYSSLYNINPIVGYSVIFAESSLRPYLEHSEVYIKSINKKVRAIGLGGIVYEIWKDELVENGIIETKQDLFFIENNIHATYFILNKYYNMKKLDKAKNQLNSALMRYFGTQNSNYQDKIMLKISNLISESLINI